MRTARLPTFQVQAHQSHYLTGAFHEAPACPCLGRKPQPIDRFLFGAFAAGPNVVKPDYAKWMLDDPRMNFAISMRGNRPGLDHLGIQVESGDELQEVYGRLKQAGSAVLEVGATTCCYAKSEKSWIEIRPASPGKPSDHGRGTLYGDSSKAKSGEARIAHAPRAARRARLTCRRRRPCEALHVRALLPVLSGPHDGRARAKALEEVVVLEDDTDTMVALVGGAWCRS